MSGSAGEAHPRRYEKRKAAGGAKALRGPATKKTFSFADSKAIPTVKIRKLIPETTYLGPS